MNRTARPTYARGILLIIFALNAACATGGCGPCGGRELTVYAGATMSDVLAELNTEFENETGVKVLLNLQPCGNLQRQIELGAPCDVFISSAPLYVDALEEKGFVKQGSRIDLLRNSLVIVTPRDSTLSLSKPEDLADEAIEVIALPDPQVASVGIYAKESFKTLGIWERIENRVVPTLGVRAALAAVESGDAQAGVIYESDLPAAKNVQIACRIPDDTHRPITFPVVIVRASEHADIARKYIDFLLTDKARAIFERHGFNMSE